MKVTMREKIFYGTGDLASNLIWASVSTFAMFYYTNVAGLSAGIIGTILLVTRVFDGISDVFFGNILDKTSTKWGKARPWLFGSAFPLGISLILLFSVPENWGDTAQYIFVFITYNFMSTICYTVSNISYNTMLSTVTTEQNDRTVMNTIRFIFAIVGTMIVNFMAMPLVNSFGGGQKGWTMMAVIFAVASVLIFMLPSLGVKERNIVATAAAEANQKGNMLKCLKLLMKNKYWVILVAILLLFYTMNGVAGVSSFFAIDVLKNPDMIGIIGMTGLLPMVIGLFFAPLIIKKFGGKRKASLAGIGGAIIFSIPALIVPTNIPVILVCFSVKSLFTVPLIASLFAFTADVVEYGDWKTGTRVEGMTYSAISVGMKVGTGLGVAFQGWLLAFAGYVNGAASQPSSAINMIIGMFIHIPFILMLILFVLVWMFKIDNIYPQILSDLKARREDRGSVNQQA